ncbi:MULTISPECIES: MarR family winged helix-turn-helix transcriptional regulator [Pasteurellaceae]|uniref:DNA-binding transcriptional regulator, MarR family n=3 Tax=Pasteurellaceae TaxID=712 RepID=A0A1H7VSW6_9PAST|nr:MULTISPECIES: MarR family transcriptional regulator [Pasteurella]MDP8052416.1 MarR family transcriptional regulator [Pasteurella atlantica]MDP8078902.1 MarR family transcriptional regulator [Pasteurella skyensis]MDP8084785.1 MarR family transcriptional regulator [Pasteurella skyensis]MDP8105167.1 MarR family transcriptional regulator [Pasteurella atlantica]MDP8148651.1 MarR family transcriptional regulator [Pasteurella atlantica]
MTTNNQQLSNQLCHRFYVISNAITRRYRVSLEKIDLTYPQYVAMMALWEEDNISVGELHKKTLIDNGCLTLMLKKMCDKNLITLIVSDTDKRMKKVKLTDKGIKLKILAQKERDKIRQEQTQALTETEYQQLVFLLDKFKSDLI